MNALLFSESRMLMFMSTSSPPPPKLSPWKILLVDDEPDILEILALEFELQGMKTITASDGQQAIEILRSEVATHIGAVLSDIRMPRADGIAVLDEAVRLWPGLPVILLTGYSDMSAESARKRGAYQLLAKPFNAERLVETVKSACASYHCANHPTDHLGHAG